MHHIQGLSNKGNLRCCSGFRVQQRDGSKSDGIAQDMADELRIHTAIPPRKEATVTVLYYHFCQDTKPKHLAVDLPFPIHQISFASCKIEEKGTIIFVPHVNWEIWLILQEPQIFASDHQCTIGLQYICVYYFLVIGMRSQDIMLRFK